MDGESEHATQRLRTRSSARAAGRRTQPALASEPDDEVGGAGDVGEDGTEAEDDDPSTPPTVDTALLELKTYLNLSSAQVLAMARENLGEQRLENIMSIQFATTDAVMSPSTAVARLALDLGLRSHVLLCLFFHTTIHTSLNCFRALRSWTTRRLRLHLRQRLRQRLHQQQQQTQGLGEEGNNRNRGKADEEKKEKTKTKTRTKPKPQLQPMLPGDFVSSGMYELVLQARRNRLQLAPCEDTIFAMSRLTIVTFTPADFREAQTLDPYMADREASTDDPDDMQDHEDVLEGIGLGHTYDKQAQEEVAQEVRLGQNDEQDQEEAAGIVDVETFEAPQVNRHRQPEDQNEGQQDGGEGDKGAGGTPGPYTLNGASAKDADGVYEDVWSLEGSSAAFIEIARGTDPVSEELGEDEVTTTVFGLRTDEEHPSPALSPPPRHFSTPIVAINSSSSTPSRTGRATTSEKKRRLIGGLQEDAAPSPAKRTRVAHLGQPGPEFSHKTWDFAVAARDRGSVPDDQRLATNQCLTDSIVNVMCEFAAAHQPRAHFVSSLTLSAAARDAMKNPAATSTQAQSPVQAADHKIPEVQDISRLIAVAHKRIGDGDSAGGHYVWVMADAVHRVVYVADSLATRAPGMSRDMLRVALAGINLLYPLPPTPSPSSLSVPPWSVQPLVCPQQINDVDCGVHTIVNCLYVAARGPKRSVATTKIAGVGHNDEGEEPTTAPFLGNLLPACRNMLLWRAIILAMLRNARLWPILGELKVVVTLAVGVDDPLLQTQEDFRIPAKTSTQMSFSLLQRELDRVRSMRAKCAARSHALQSVLDDLDATVEHVFEPFQRRWKICKLDAELKIRKLECARARIEEAMRLTDMLGIGTSSLSRARAELAGVLGELRLLRRRQVHVLLALTNGHARLQALELGGCRKLLAEAVARYGDAAREDRPTG